MPDSKYCYPGTEVLINKLNIREASDLFQAEKELTYIRLQELQENPITGEFDFSHLKAIHRYIFQDIYEWAGRPRTVEIGKGNLFCTVACIQDYANTVFKKYYAQCYAAKENFDDFVRIFADNYGDLNALHPFREGNGRTQREFARLVCLTCGYDFDLSCSTHAEMLEASQISFNKGDSTAFIKIFSQALTQHIDGDREYKYLQILAMDDLSIGSSSTYAYDEYSKSETPEIYEGLYKARISKMQAEKAISDANAALSKEQQTKGRQKVNIENKELNGGLSRGRIDQRDASARGK